MRNSACRLLISRIYRGQGANHRPKNSSISAWIGPRLTPVDQLLARVRSVTWLELTSAPATPQAGTGRHRGPFSKRRCRAGSSLGLDQLKTMDSPSPSSTAPLPPLRVATGPPVSTRAQSAIYQTFSSELTSIPASRAGGAEPSPVPALVAIGTFHLYHNVGLAKQTREQTDKSHAR
ncbi:hypothetical protein ElyMa_002277500 [Elysia marginata]|uniref:Uncharacterized protein n=1 Tax=Elysia marginata TaxID=1093978 RepID=A0AAV4FZW0_9GAST|nr:hypothetical protein ElyMa_002277500 [Elysia marginata]